MRPAYAQQVLTPVIVSQGSLRNLDLKALSTKYKEGELGELQFPFSGLSLDDMIATYQSAGELDLDLPRRHPQPTDTGWRYETVR